MDYYKEYTVTLEVLVFAHDKEDAANKIRRISDLEWSRVVNVEERKE